MALKWEKNGFTHTVQTEIGELKVSQPNSTAWWSVWVLGRKLDQQTPTLSAAKKLAVETALTRIEERIKKLEEVAK